MDASEITTWVSLVVTTVTPICGAIWKFGRAILEKIEAAHASTLKLKEEFRTFRDETLEDFRALSLSVQNLSARVGGLEKDVAKALSIESRLTDIFQRLVSLETKNTHS